jgi:hypothetical protein
MTDLLTPSQAAQLNTIDADPNLAASSKRQYKRALIRCWVAGVDVTDPLDLADYAGGLGAGVGG